MTDGVTAQPLAAESDPNAQLEAGADAFKAFLNPPDPQPRDDAGKFASTTEVEEETEAAPAVDEDEHIDEAEAAEEAQPEAVEMPSSWSNEEAEQWASIPPETQAFIARREGDRDAAVNQKFQEAANARKANEAAMAEANVNRDRYATALEQVLEVIKPVRPTREQFALGDGTYDRDAFEAAKDAYDDNVELYSLLEVQRNEVFAQREQGADQAIIDRVAEINRVAAPEFVKDVPDLADPAKAGAIMDGVVKYAIAQGIPEDTFVGAAAQTVSLAELRIAWKAQQYDLIQAAKARVSATNPPPKPAQPALRPGGVATRQSVEARRYAQASERLTKEGSVEAGAAVFKHLFKGT